MIRNGTRISAIHAGQCYVGRVVGIDDHTGAITIDEGGLLSILPADALVLTLEPAANLTTTPPRRPGPLVELAGVVLGWAGAAAVVGVLIGTTWAVHDWLR